MVPLVGGLGLRTRSIPLVDGKRDNASSAGGAKEFLALGYQELALGLPWHGVGPPKRGVGYSMALGPHLWYGVGCLVALGDM